MQQLTWKGPAQAAMNSAEVAEKELVSTERQSASGTFGKSYRLSTPGSVDTWHRAVQVKNNVKLLMAIKFMIGLNIKEYVQDVTIKETIFTADGKSRESLH